MRTAAPMTTGTSPDVPELVFDGGLPGFPASHRYALVEWGAAGSGLFVLRSLDEEGVEFVVITPGVFFPDYAPEIDDVTAQRLGLRVADDALLLVIVTLGERPEAATANLFARSSSIAAAGAARRPSSPAPSTRCGSRCRPEPAYAGRPGPPRRERQCSCSAAAPARAS